MIDAVLGDLLTEPPPQPAAPEMPSMPEEAAVDEEMAAAVCGEYYSAEVDCVCGFPTPRSLSTLGLRCLFPRPVPSNPALWPSDTVAVDGKGADDGVILTLEQQRRGRWQLRAFRDPSAPASAQGLSAFRFVVFGGGGARICRFEDDGSGFRLTTGAPDSARVRNLWFGRLPEGVLAAAGTPPGL